MTENITQALGAILFMLAAICGFLAAPDFSEAISRFILRLASVACLVGSIALTIPLIAKRFK